MDPFDLDFEQDENASKTNAALVNKNYQQFNKSKYNASTYTKGFFNADEDEYGEAKPMDSPSKNSPKKQEQSGKKSRRRKGPVKLQPLRQQQKVQVFANTNQFDDRQQDELEEVIEFKPEQKKEHSRPINLVFDDPSEQQPVQEPPRRAQPRFQQDVYNTNQEVNQTRQQISIPPSRNVLGDFVEDDDSDEDVVEPSQPSNIADSTYFNYDTPQNLRKQLVDSVKPGNVLRLELIRDKSGFNTFWPQFHVHFCRNSQYVMSAKKTSSKPASTFVMSCNKGNFEENSPYYIGKMKSNVLGDILNIFGPGYNPTNARDKNQVPRQLIATIVYESHLFQMGKPRQFQIFVKKPQYRYYNAFPQVRMYDEEISLSQLYEHPQNRDKIWVFKNRKPKWIDSLGGYMLNFRGRVEVASIKNFILEQKQEGPDIMLFGKVNDSKFNLDIMSPISPLIAFGLALSSFDSRIMCE